MDFYQIYFADLILGRKIKMEKLKLYVGMMFLAGRTKKSVR